LHTPNDEYKPNWAELYMLNKTAEAAILSGELDELRHANASSFHLLSIYLMSLHERLTTMERSDEDRLEKLKITSDQSVFDAREVEDIGGGRIILDE